MSRVGHIASAWSVVHLAEGAVVETSAARQLCELRLGLRRLHVEASLLGIPRDIAASSSERCTHAITRDGLDRVVTSLLGTPDISTAYVGAFCVEHDEAAGRS